MPSNESLEQARAVLKKWTERTTDRGQNFVELIAEALDVAWQRGYDDALMAVQFTKVREALKHAD